MGGKQAGQRGAILVISGPSGAGKTTLVKRLLADKDLVWSVSATTRSPRAGEENGKDYWFLTRQEFERRVGAGEFVEFAESFGNLYGTPAGPLRDAVEAGRVMVLDIDVQGARQVCRKFPAAVLVFVTAPSEEELLRRLEGRNTEDQATLSRRLARVREEMAARHEYDHVIVNEDLEEALGKLREIVAGLKA